MVIPERGCGMCGSWLLNVGKRKLRIRSHSRKDSQVNAAGVGTGEADGTAESSPGLKVTFRGRVTELPTGTAG